MARTSWFPCNYEGASVPLAGILNAHTSSVVQRFEKRVFCPAFADFLSSASAEKLFFFPFLFFTQHFSKGKMSPACACEMREYSIPDLAKIGRILMKSFLGLLSRFFAPRVRSFISCLLAGFDSIDWRDVMRSARAKMTQ